MIRLIMWPFTAFLPLILFVYFQSYMACEYQKEIGNKTIKIEVKVNQCTAGERTAEEFKQFFTNIQRLIGK